MGQSSQIIECSDAADCQAKVIELCRIEGLEGIRVKHEATIYSNKAEAETYLKRVVDGWTNPAVSVPYYDYPAIEYGSLYEAQKEVIEQISIERRNNLLSCFQETGTIKLVNCNTCKSKVNLTYLKDNAYHGVQTGDMQSVLNTNRFVFYSGANENKGIQDIRRYIEGEQFGFRCAVAYCKGRGLRPTGFARDLRAIDQIEARYRAELQKLLVMYEQKTRGVQKVLKYLTMVSIHDSAYY